MTKKGLHKLCKKQSLKGQLTTSTTASVFHQKKLGTLTLKEKLLKMSLVRWSDCMARQWTLPIANKPKLLCKKVNSDFELYLNKRRSALLKCGHTVNF